jgi:hypothetical protein
MDEKPARGAPLPNSGVPYICFHVFTVFPFFGQMHGYRGPRHRPAPPDLQIFPRAQRSAFHIVKDRGFHALVIFLPAVIRKRCHVVENQPVLLGIKPCWIVGVSRAPGRAISVDQLPKRRIIGSLLLRPRPDKRQQSTAKGQQHIQEPSPSFSTSGVHTICLQDHLRLPQELFGTRGKKTDWIVADTLWRIVRICKGSYRAI